MIVREASTVEGTSVCPGCRAVLPASSGPSHAYYGCSPECWACYGAVLAREFGEPAYFAIHQLTVDAYAAQHPGMPERRAIQSVAIHLMTMAMILDGKLDPREGPSLHMLREFGGVFGVAVAAAVFAGAGSYASPGAFLDGFAPAAAVLAGFSAVGAIIALALPGRRQPAESVPVGAVPALEGAGGS